MVSQWQVYRFRDKACASSNIHTYQVSHTPVGVEFLSDAKDKGGHKARLLLLKEIKQKQNFPV